MTERRSSREEGRANETTKRRGGTLRQGRSWTRRYIPPLHQAWQPPNPPTNAATDCAQPGAATHLRSDMCLLPVPRTRHSKRTPGRDESTMDPNSSSLVPVPRPSPFASHPQEVGQKKKKVAGQPVSNSAPAKCFQSACFMAAGQCHEPTVSPFSVVAGDRRIELDRGGAWVGNETDQVFEAPRAGPLDRRPIGLCRAVEPHGPGRSVCLCLSGNQPEPSMSTSSFQIDMCKCSPMVRPDGRDHILWPRGAGLLLSMGSTAIKEKNSNSQQSTWTKSDPPASTPSWTWYLTPNIPNPLHPIPGPLVKW